jgi:hypothetical protein
MSAEAAKLADRAARFNLPPSEDAKKAARAAKFGDMLDKAQTVVVPKKPVLSAEEQAALDAKLKARADRFGIKTDKMLAEEEAARKKARADRFAGAGGGSSSGGESEGAAKRPMDPELAEKMAKRAKRFGNGGAEEAPTEP